MYDVPPLCSQLLGTGQHFHHTKRFDINKTAGKRAVQRQTPAANAMVFFRLDCNQCQVSAPTSKRTTPSRRAVTPGGKIHNLQTRKQRLEFLHKGLVQRMRAVTVQC